MTTSPTRRYCACGTRLGQDRVGERCAQCDRTLVALRAAPPPVPPEFWMSEQFRCAFQAHHIGQVSRAYRKHPHQIAAYGKDGISQEIVGSWLGLTQAQISRIETGPPVRHLDNLAHWARTLRIPQHLLWFRLPQPVAALGARGEGFDLAGRSAINVSDPPRITTELMAPELAGNADVSAMRAFRAADKNVGGAHLYDTVVRYLRTNVANRLFGADSDGDAQVTFNGAAALTEMAGWMAHDAGRDAAARRHFDRSLDLVKVGGDRQLGAHILGSMSHLALHLNDPEQAIGLANQGREVLRRARQPALAARLLAMQARSWARLQRHQQSAQLLLEAEDALGCQRGEEPSPWISHFDEGSLASDNARCLRQLGDFRAAHQQAERVVSLRPGGRTRSRAFGQLIMVKVLIAQGEPEQACAVARDVIDTTSSLGSFLVSQELLDLQTLLEPYRAQPVVAEFLVCLDEGLRDRLWLNHRVGEDSTSEDSQSRAGHDG